MKMILGVSMGLAAMAFIIITVASNAIVSHNQAYAVVNVAKEQTKQSGIEWGARVDIAEIEADRDVSIAEIGADRDVLTSWPWNIFSLIKLLLLILAAAAGLWAYLALIHKTEEL